MRWGRCPAALHPPFQDSGPAPLKPGAPKKGMAWIQVAVLAVSGVAYLLGTKALGKKKPADVLGSHGPRCGYCMSLRPQKDNCFDTYVFFANDPFGRHGPTWSYTFYRGTVVNAWNGERCRAPSDTFEKARLQLKNLPFYSQQPNSMQSFDQFGLSELLDWIVIASKPQAAPAYNPLPVAQLLHDPKWKSFTFAFARGWIQSGWILRRAERGVEIKKNQQIFIILTRLFQQSSLPLRCFYLNLAGKNHRRLASWRGAFPACFPLLSHCKFRAPGCWTIVENDRLDGEAVCTGQFQAMATVGRFELTKSVFQSITRLLLSFRWPC